jgi:hypothetical protein
MEIAMDGITTSNKRDYGNHCMEPVPESDVFWNVSQYRLDDRIRQLCAKVVASSDQDLGPSIAELKAALRQHNERLRKLALAQLGACGLRTIGPKTTCARTAPADTFAFCIPARAIVLFASVIVSKTSECV